MKLKLKLVIAIFLVFLITSACFGKEIGFKDNNEIKIYCESFLGLIVKGKVNEAFDVVEEQWIFPGSELQNMTVQTLKNLDLVKGRFGKPLSFNFIKEEEIEDVCLKYTYVIKCENHLLRWMFVFYKPKDRWILNSFKWDDLIEKLFTE